MELILVDPYDELPRGQKTIIIPQKEQQELLFFRFLIQTLFHYLIFIDYHYNKNEPYLKIFIFDPSGE